MGRPRTIDDETILAAARELFQARGHGASTRDVARAAGISQAVLYQRFGSKEALFFRAMRPHPPDLEAIVPATELTRVVSVADVEPWLAGVMVRMLAAMQRSTPALLRFITHPGFTPQTLAHVHDDLLAGSLVTVLAGRLAELARRGLVTHDDPGSSAGAIVAAVHSLAMMTMLDPAAHADARHPVIMSRMARTFVRGLAPR
ncbi:MAG: TetR/AcrR family transcriptional regulator [Gemmatimonadaceae bacterium]|jgi:AcrR family transcriptional regulator|nr:TetR/AcrR family transcriptional regulator [Gemmatimonadaceae bacterium]